MSDIIKVTKEISELPENEREYATIAFGLLKSTKYVMLAPEIGRILSRMNKESADYVLESIKKKDLEGESLRNALPILEKISFLDSANESQQISLVVFSLLKDYEDKILSAEIGSIFADMSKKSAEIGVEIITRGDLKGKSLQDVLPIFKEISVLDDTNEGQQIALVSLSFLQGTEFASLSTKFTFEKQIEVLKNCGPSSAPTIVELGVSLEDVVETWIGAGTTPEGICELMGGSKNYVDLGHEEL